MPGETVNEFFHWHRVVGRRHLIHGQSLKLAAWSCIGPDGCTCWMRKGGAPDCRGKYGQHGEEWRYRLYGPVEKRGNAWEIVDVPFKWAGPNRSAPDVPEVEEDEDEDEDDPEAPIEWPVAKPGVAGIELLVYTPILAHGRDGDGAFWPVSAWVHVPGNDPCDILPTKCRAIEMKIPKKDEWREMIAWEDDTWEEVQVDESGRVIEAPFVRGEKFWEWMTATFFRGVPLIR